MGDVDIKFIGAVSIGFALFFGGMSLLVGDKKSSLDYVSLTNSCHTHTNPTPCLKMVRVWQSEELRGN